MRFGFTLIELLIVLGIGGLIIAGAGLAFNHLPSESQLDDVTQALTQVIELARGRSVAGMASSTNGVFLEVNNGTPDRYVIFRGASYAARDASYDEAIEIGEAINLEPDLSLGANEITFTPLEGQPSATGTIILSHSIGDQRAILINDLGFTSSQ